ncbi:hypothetical protein NON08_11680 [Cetobacterium somerae]|uniref:hypothetical protein n=1 Tax=Cetobacterium sp. NK01 TaxID=2993530 RepID=UPI0021161F4D|nr:hypothetical protein [Cetobacterium sp. NK01]MCQ8213159.1 hypothetical protein [Cetobacterium sp. NK01]
MKILVSILINILSVLYVLKISQLGYNVLDLINGLIFTFSFGFGIPIVFSGILTIIILLSPGILTYYLYKYFIKFFKKR